MNESLFGNNHNVKVGEHWRLQTLRNPYMCPLLEADGQKYIPPRQMFLMIDHLVDGKLSDDCCYMDSEILSVTPEVIVCKLLGGPPPDFPGGYSIIEVLNDNTIVRFFRKE